MIKINLAKTFTSPSAKSSAFSGMSSNSQAKLVFKIFLIFAPLALIWFYEKKDLEVKGQILASTRAEQTALAQQLVQLNGARVAIKQVEEQKKEMEEKFAILRKIFGLRHQKLQSIRVLQDHIEKNSWISNIKLVGTEIDVVGYSPSIEESQSYISSIGQFKNLFKSVVTRSIKKEKKIGREIYRFQILLELKE